MALIHQFTTNRTVGISVTPNGHWQHLPLSTAVVVNFPESIPTFTGLRLDRQPAV
ncbi:MAG: hypothetical protein ACKOEO_01055 [Planctomycetaceae bacterium]